MGQRHVVRLVRAALALTACAVCVLCRAEGARAEEPGCGVMPVVLRPGTVAYPLPHTFLRAGSDSAWTRDRVWRAGTDYALDRLRGELRVLRVIDRIDTLSVRACWLLHPPPLEFQVQRYRPLTAPDSVPAAPPPSPGERPVTARSATVAPSGTALNLTGNKTIAVDFGSSQDAFLRQSLDLALSGTLAPGVQLTGVLSDRNTPLSASGSTQDLQALDRVLIELTAPNGRATLGDLTVRNDQGEFGRVERRLQGVSGLWSARGFQSTVAAASAAGEYNRLQFFGIEGQQGPYRLTDRDGNPGVSVVAGSEVVTLDGARLTRGEGSDYAIDYERAQITFTNRHLISSASRITVDYQFALNRFRRNFAEAGTRWDRGPGYGWVRMLHEGDDRGRPLDLTFDAVDRAALEAAGDSAALAIGPGVTPGVGDYDTVRVNPSTVIFAFAGVDSGSFAVRFARVAAGSGDYQDSALVQGRITYHYVGPNAGSFRVGRALPLPESHQLWSSGAGLKLGALSAEMEGALSRRDLNTFSALDDRDNTGVAGRARLRLEGHAPGVGGSGALELRARSVADRFQPFTRLERPFEQEGWSLPLATDLEHQRRVELAGQWRPSFGGELNGLIGRVNTIQGYRALRRSAEWSRDGRFMTRAMWEHADAQRAGSVDGERDHWRTELRLRGRWVQPAVRAEADRRLFPSDSGRVGDRFRSVGFELASGSAARWHALASLDQRRDGRAVPAGFEDQSLARTAKLAIESPSTGALGAALLAQRRDVSPLADPRRSRSDLASLRLRAENATRGLKGQYNLEVTSQGENQRTRALVFVGSGRGAYDALGNFVGTGDYDLVVTVSQTLERLARAASSARTSWDFGSSDAWRGSRIEYTFETETRRRGDLRARDPFISPGAALADPALARGSVLQRLETDLAPGSHSAAIRLRVERRVSADRAFANFAQTTDDRQASARWRARPGAVVSTEVEGSLRRQQAVQQLTGGGTYARTLEDVGGTGNLIYTPDARLRAVGALELSWSRPEGAVERTRTLRLGPDFGVALGGRGRAEVTIRRAFITGPPPQSLLPTAERAGAARWDASSRLDYRVRESTTLGVSMNVREREGVGTKYTGRAELRAFF